MPNHKRAMPPATSDDGEWPEFRRWYALTLEEERIYNEADDADRERQLDVVDDERNPLKRAMLAREPQTLRHLAMLAVIELRHADKNAGDTVSLLSFGTMQQENGGWVQGAVLIEAVLKLALAQNLLPGVVIHGAGGNA